MHKLNPSKNELAHISKANLSSIIPALAGKCVSNNWRNTPWVINWFKNLGHKENRGFIKFHVADFYLTISEDLLSRAVSYAKTIMVTEDEVVDAIKFTQKLLLLSKKGTWVKRGENP